MRENLRTLRGLALAGVVACAGGAELQAQQDSSYVMATGRSNGHAHAVGADVASFVSAKMPSTDINTITSSGYVENIRLLQDDTAQLAVMQAMFAHFERTGTGTFMGEGARDDLRAIAQLWRDADHVVMLKDHVQTGTIEDVVKLRGQPVAMGRLGPGPLESNRLMLANFGVDMDEAYDCRFLTYRESARALQNGEVVVMSTPIRPPGPHIVETFNESGDQLQILEFKDEQVAAADGGLGLWTGYTIPAGTYAGQDEDIMTVGKSNMLVARADLDEEAAYRLTKAIFENLDELHDLGPAMDEVSLEHALLGLTVPLHPGALRYYKEAGILPRDAEIDSAMGETLRAPDVAFAPNGAPISAFELAAREGGEGASEPADLEKFRVYFRIDQLKPSGDAMREVSAAASFAKQNPLTEIVVAGHADRAGVEVYNLHVAQARAKAVAAALREQGVPARRIRVTQYGETAPAVPTEDGVHEALNRRVEITFMPNDRMMVSAGQQEAD